ncbi:GNAT family N-acetyltransferase [Streptomyces sp. NPDC004250]|uniref:GNAT family N-acetyltransferase n=1 Tax=Streptomyces sp. NPDC004250 TaxID=3364692 RepID=UPI0036A0879D
MSAIFRTRRLTIRAFKAADAPAVYAMWSDPEVCRYTGDEPATDLSVIVEDIARWQRVTTGGPGCGFWAVDAYPAGFVGDVYVRPFAEIPGEQEIGWHVSRPHWGRGYATEAAAAAIRYAHAAGVSRLVALIDPDHQASLRVAEKAGLLYEGLSDRYAPGEPTSAVFVSTVPMCTGL